MDITLTYTQAQLDILDNLRDDTKYVVITKGRRFGATQGFSHFLIECALSGEQCLWVDTIYSNIDRYVERYFIKALKQSNIKYNWNGQKKILIIGSGYIDFRSADKPENIEGFGYHKIFLNEAGIILKNDYLFTNAILPMLLDFQDSMLIAAGVPKGVTLKNGNKHRFYLLDQYARAGEAGYQRFNFSSYDNNLLKEEDIKALEIEISRMNPLMVDQEIYGKFVDGAIGSLWDETILSNARVSRNIVEEFKKVIVAIDPATTAKIDSDETGIIVAGLGEDNKAYIIEDASGTYTPNEWASKAIQLADKHEADYIVAETNQGGDMVKTIIKSFSTKYRVKTIHASKGKFIRAEPVYNLYEQGNVKHIGTLTKLEVQMTSFDPVSGKNKDDRVDALVYAVTDLLIKKKEMIVV